MHQACIRFAHYLHRRFAQSSTPKHYLSDLYLFIQAISEKTPEAVTAADIDGFVDQQIATGLSPATINRRLSCLHSFFEFLAGEQPEKHWPNPVSHPRHYLKLGAHLPRDASDHDVTRLFAVITDERDQAMFGLMVDAGLRVGEVTALRLDSLEAPTAPEQMARLHLCGKGSKERIVWLTTSLWQRLCAWLAVRPAAETDHFFLNRHAQPLSVSGIQYRLQQSCLAAGVTLTCHQLRHTFARRLVEHGLPVDSLAMLLGHSQLHTTQRYIDGANPTVRADFTAAIAQLETLFIHDRVAPLARPASCPLTKPRTASPAELPKLHERLAALPLWRPRALRRTFVGAGRPGGRKRRRFW
jgi:site-specific recombinase XerD